MSKKIAVIGGGGFAKEVIEVAEMLGHQVYGIFSDKPNDIGYQHKGYLDELLKLKDEYDGVNVAIGVTNKAGIQTRKSIIEFLDKHQITTISLISPLATISPVAKIGQGVYIAHDVIVALDAIIGNNSIFNTSARIGHDSIIGNNVSIGPQVFIGGGTHIHDDVMIGVASTIRQDIKVGQGSIIGMKSLVIKSLKSNSFVFTLPSKISTNA